MNRRAFLKNSMLSAAALTAAPVRSATPARGPLEPNAAPAAAGVSLIDTNVHLFEWPFRHLKYGKTPALVAKLRKHNVRQAWAGSFEALFSKDLTGVNARLVEECRRHGEGMLVPVGSVNPAWPDWEEELRRCHEVHRLGIIRLHPCYQNYALDDPAFARLLHLATERKLVVQIALELEDPRVHHPAIPAASVNAAALAAVLPKVPRARVQLIDDSFSWIRVPQAKPLLGFTNLLHDIAALESVGAVGRLIEGRHWNLRGQVPVERLLFGSHAPYFPIEAALLRMFESPLTREQMTAIMETNARRLLHPV